MPQEGRQAWGGCGDRGAAWRPPSLQEVLGFPALRPRPPVGRYLEAGPRGAVLRAEPRGGLVAL